MTCFDCSYFCNNSFRTVPQPNDSRCVSGCLERKKNGYVRIDPRFDQFGHSSGCSDLYVVHIVCRPDVSFICSAVGFLERIMQLYCYHPLVVTIFMWFESSSNQGFLYLLTLFNICSDFLNCGVSKRLCYEKVLNLERLISLMRSHMRAYYRASLLWKFWLLMFKICVPVSSLLFGYDYRLFLVL